MPFTPVNIIRSLPLGMKVASHDPRSSIQLGWNNVSRKVALKKKGREYAGLSPFKVEKTPSFFVNDQKGFYHCFASGEHGDIFKFVMETEGLTFPEAVERLASEAGLPMPKMSEHEIEAEDARQRLYALLDAAARFFEDSLRGPAGTGARPANSRMAG